MLCAYFLGLFSSHERKKKYWEQLELRCRHLYRRPPPFGGHHHPHLTSAAAASIMLTPGSQCGYCTEDPRYYNMHPPELCPGGLWGGPAAASTTTEVTTADSCYWNPPRNGNFYSPNPEMMLQQPQQPQTSSTSEAANGNDGSESRPLSRTLTRSLSRSFRNWFPWLSSRIAASAASEANHPSAAAAEVQMRSSRPPGAVNPMWRHSNPDSHYGFRVGPSQSSASISGGYRGRGGYHLPSSGTTPADLSHYAAIPSDHLPRYLWGPPPPYSQPPSIENIREAASSDEAPNLSRGLEVANQSQTVATSTVTSTNQVKISSLPIYPNFFK